MTIQTPVHILRPAEPPSPAPEVRPFRIAICGEVRSGKSTLLAALLRRQALPDTLGLERPPLIRAVHGDRDGIRVRSGGRSREAGPADDYMAEAEKVTITTRAAHIEGIELIEIPLTRAEEVDPSQVDLVATCDAMVWVTIAAQAWRLTEKTLVEALSERAPERRMLVVSRADKLRSDGDRAKLAQRLERETGALFGPPVFMDGAGATLEEAAGDAAAWSRTGAPAILESLGLTRPEAPQVVNLGTFRRPSPPPLPFDLGALRARAESLGEGHVAGILVRGHGALPLSGPRDEAQRIGAACETARREVSTHMAFADTAGPVEVVSVTCGPRRLLWRVVQGRGTLYLLTAPGTAEGPARALLSGLVSAL